MSPHTQPCLPGSCVRVAVNEQVESVELIIEALRALQALQDAGVQCQEAIRVQSVADELREIQLRNTQERDQL